MEIKENEELRDLAPSMAQEDFEKLKRSISLKGQLEPLQVMVDGTLIDGYHRYLALKQLQIEPKVVSRSEIKTIQQAKELSRELNRNRRHLNPYQRKVMDLKTFTGEDLETIASKTGNSANTLSKVKKIMEDAPEAIKKKLDEGNLGYKEVYEYLTALDKVPKDKKELFTDELAEGKMELPIKEIVSTAEGVANMLAEYNQLVQKQIAPNFEDILYTPKMDSKTFNQMSHDLQVASGGNPKLKTVYLEIGATDVPKTEEEAKAFAKRCGGRFVGKVAKEYWEIEVDPLKE